MHPADDYPMNQAPLQSEGALTLESEPEATIASLKHRFEAVRRYELSRMRRRLGQLSSTQENAIESLTHGIIDQILHAPIAVLKVASEESDSPSVIEMVNRVFSLNVDSGPGRTD